MCWDSRGPEQSMEATMGPGGVREGAAGEDKPSPVCFFPCLV
jgi:hypothetical protein